MEQNPRDAARISFGDAVRVRREISQKIEDLKNPRGNHNYTSRLEDIETLMKELRLHSMQTVSHDFQYAVEKDVEACLWQSHTQLNAEYKRILGRVGAQNQVVQKRKVDKLYRDFLKISQFFYRGYIQRLASRFNIPELRQAAYGLELEPSSVPTNDCAPGSPAREMILKSCYMTLVRLGDLARYRCQASDKPAKGNFDTAVTYYSLANILDPNDGSCHHQMAVLHQTHGQQLNIIYYFHRSISIAKPYQLGLPNLEKVFKNLENQLSAKRGSGRDATKDTSDAMTKWFLRLQAMYFQGDEFTARQELEKEVLHRLDLTVKGDGNEEVVLKMILINIAAYDIALEKVNEKWTMKSSKSCQFLLQFSVQMAAVLLRQFKAALEAEDTATLADENKAEDPESNTELSAALYKLLPLLRVYIGWLYVLNEDLVRYQDFLEPSIRDIYRLLAESMTLLIPYAISNHRVIKSKYLLPEDVEAVGLRLLASQNLPLFLQIEKSAQSPEHVTLLKPRKTAMNHPCKPQTESIWRIRDILCCGVLMAATAGFPLQVTTRHGAESWVYIEDSNLHDCDYLDGASLYQMLTNLKVSNYGRVATDEDAAQRSSEQPVDLDEAAVNHPITSASSPSRIPQAVPEVDQSTARREKEPANNFDTDFNRDKEMLKMVDELCMDDDDVLSNRAAADTTYGMSSSMANELSGLADSANLRRSAGHKNLNKIDQHRDYFYPSSSRISASELTGLAFDNLYFATNHKAATGLRDFVPPTGTSAESGDVLQLAGHQNTRSRFFPFDALRISGGSPSALVSAPFLQHNSALPYEAHTLKSGQSAHKAQYESGAGSRRAQPPTMSSSPLFNTDKGYQAEDGDWRLHDNMAAQRTLDLQGAQRMSELLASPPSSSVLTPPSADTANRGAQLHSSVDRSVGSRSSGSLLMPSALPSTTSPALGAATDAQSYQYRGYQGYPRPSSQGLYRDSPASASSSTEQISADISHAHPYNPSSLAFSNTSSLWAGTPGTIACNGNFFNASTPYGRLGGVNNREDPMHFRNQAKALFGNDGSSEYDRQILLAALEDDNSKPR